VQQVPADRRQQLLTALAARFGDEGVANFVDDTIGLLPYNASVDAAQATQVAAGDVWFHERHMTSPVPLNMKSTCRLLSIDGRTAEIDITGRISQETVGVVGQNQVQLRDGRSMGSCVIDQSTGLPVKSNLSSYLNMLVTTADGQTVEQDKRVETTIQTFPNSRDSVLTSAQQASTQRPAVQQAPGMFIQPGNSATMPGQNSPSSVRPFSQTAQTPPPATGIQQVSGLQSTGGVPNMGGIQVIPGNRPPGPTPLPGGVDPANLKSTAQAVYPD